MVPTHRTLLICRQTVAREFRLGPFRFATRRSDWSVEHRSAAEGEGGAEIENSATPAAVSFRAACATTLPGDRSGGVAAEPRSHP